MPSSDLPAWLQQRGGGSGRRRGDQSHRAATAALALLIFAGGGGAGYLFASRHGAPPPAPPPPVCPPAVACVSPPATGGGGSTGAAHAVRHTKVAKSSPAALLPLPSGKPMEEGERTKALRAFAAERAPELRQCLDDPDRGPPQELGAAFEIAANGHVDLVQILGADATTNEVRHCYASHLKKWHFPTELLRGEEKLLVNFVL